MIRKHAEQKELSITVLSCGSAAVGGRRGRGDREEQEKEETGKDQSFNLEGNGLQEGAAEMKTLKRFCYACCLNVCSIGSKGHYKGRN